MKFVKYLLVAVAACAGLANAATSSTTLTQLNQQAAINQRLAAPSVKYAAYTQALSTYTTLAAQVKAKEAALAKLSGAALVSAKRDLNTLKGKMINANSAVASAKSAYNAAVTDANGLIGVKYVSTGTSGYYINTSAAKKWAYL